MRAPDECDEGADPQPHTGSQGRQEPRAAGADASCHSGEVGVPAVMVKRWVLRPYIFRVIL